MPIIVDLNFILVPEDSLVRFLANKVRATVSSWSISATWHEENSGQHEQDCVFNKKAFCKD
jgi:hypothetical protein